jgi:hypothetical protein
MYTGRVGRNDVTSEWIRNTHAFVERTFGEAAKGASLVPCSCSKCVNRKRKSKKTVRKMDPGPFGSIGFGV